METATEKLNKTRAAVPTPETSYAATDPLVDHGHMHEPARRAIAPDANTVLPEYDSIYGSLCEAPVGQLKVLATKHSVTVADATWEPDPAIQTEVDALDAVIKDLAEKEANDIGYAKLQQAA